MELSAPALDNVKDTLGRGRQATTDNIIGFQVILEVKQERIPKSIILTDHKICVFSSKVPPRYEGGWYFGEIQEVDSPHMGLCNMVLDGRQMTILAPQECRTLDPFLSELMKKISQNFPQVPLQRLLSKFEIRPPDRFQTLSKVFWEHGGYNAGPCGSFTQMFRHACAFHNTQFRDDIAWDVDTLFFSHDCHDFALDDFDHLTTKTCSAMISALALNTWFTCFDTGGLKLHNDIYAELVRMLKTNSTIETLKLTGSPVRADFFARLAHSLKSNPDSALSGLDLSATSVDERCWKEIANALSFFESGVRLLNFSRTGLTGRAVAKLIDSIKLLDATNTLQSLDLSDNPLKIDDVAHPLCAFLQTENQLTTLNLSNTDCAFDVLCLSVSQGCTKNLRHLNLSRCTIRSKNREHRTPKQWRDFLINAEKLRHLNLSSNRWSIEALKDLLTGIQSNQQITGLELDISACSLGSNEATLLSTLLPHVQQITSLDLSENSFEASDWSSIFTGLSKNCHLKKLTLNRNFLSIKTKSKQMGEMMDRFDQFLGSPHCKLVQLALCDCRLRDPDLAKILNTLGGSNITIRLLDLAGNQLGDLGAKALGKTLQLNKTLRSVIIDRNGITPLGLEHIGNALEQNYSLVRLPLPLIDIQNCMRSMPERTEAAVKRIERFLERNDRGKMNARLCRQQYRYQEAVLVGAVDDVMKNSLDDCEATVAKMEREPLLTDDVRKTKTVLTEARHSKQLLSAVFNAISDTVMKESEQISKKISEDMQRQLSGVSKTAADHLVTRLKSSYPAIAEQQDIQSAIKDIDVSISDHEAFSRFNFHLENQIGALANQLSMDLASAICTKLTDVVQAALQSSTEHLARSKKLASTIQSVTMPEDWFGTISKRKRRPASSLEEREDMFEKPTPDETAPKIEPERTAPPVPKPPSKLDQEKTAAAPSKPVYPTLPTAEDLENQKPAANVTRKPSSPLGPPPSLSPSAPPKTPKSATPTMSTPKISVTPSLSFTKKGKSFDSPAAPVESSEPAALKHVSKQRPKMARRKAPSRPKSAITPDESAGVDTFFEPAAVNRQVVQIDKANVERSSSNLSEKEETPEPERKPAHPMMRPKPRGITPGQRPFSLFPTSFDPSGRPPKARNSL